jgi:hypothetical protein
MLTNPPKNYPLVFPYSESQKDLLHKKKEEKNDSDSGLPDGIFSNRKPQFGIGNFGVSCKERCW